MSHISKEKAEFKIVDAFNGLEIVDADYQEQTFSKHVHEGYTIGVIDKGAQRFERSGSTHIADENSIIFVNADDVHTGESATQDGWRYRAMYPHPSHFESMTNDLYDGQFNAPYFNHAVVKDPQLSAQLRLLFTQIDSNASKLLIETILYSIMMNMTLRHSSMKNIPDDISGSKQRLLLVKEYLDAYPEENVSLLTLATMAGLSQFHFIRQFKKVFYIAPHSYQIQMRLKKAKTLLMLGVKPVQVAADCGFHDQSHFNRHFKKAMGTSPSKFQKQAVLYKMP
ncbi:AraC family transcriptional regulator [Moritella sp.]|uniref:AraC family transcriptional regulator n=1 Tax=Moritella sp. TaxID=78556 RepID=UPI001DAF6582|nr:AraC family transcriptional regulator [Moritella sp.]MCJ8349303.1 AraC family transcriptional regulator [Moritella sp.]NQZ39589.1 AraC family transcriptional regulator [Moritella sp.]